MFASPDRIKAHMERVLDETCRRLPRGGDHTLRSFVAMQMLDAASFDNVTFGHLQIVASKALADYEAAA